MEQTTQQEWKAKGVELGYVLGLSLILAGIIYFFASNWPGLDKWTKITLSLGLLILFYFVSFLMKYVFYKHPLLSPLFLFFGCLAFGVCVALLGQIYNSHADSFMLFVIWAIPALLFSYFTKFQPFYVLSFLVIHVAFYLFLFPTSGFQYVPELLIKWLLLGMAILNGILFICIEKSIIKSRPLQYLSFIALHILVLSLTMEQLLDPFNVFASLLYMGVLGFFYAYLIRKELHKSFLILLGLVSIAFVVIKFIEFVVYTNTEYIFLFTMILPFLIIGLVIFGLRKWKQKSSGGEHSFNRNIIIGITTAVSSIIAGSSLYGMTFLFFDNIPFMFFTFFSIALILLAKLKQTWDSIITYTLLFTAIFIGIPATFTFESSLIIDLLFIMSLAYVFWNFNLRLIRYIVYLSMMVVITGSFFEITDITKEVVLISILLLNITIYFISIGISPNCVKQILIHNSLFYGLLSFFILTFLFENQPVIYYLINIFYFVVTTLLVIWALRGNYPVRYYLFLTFWFAYIVYKYYDLIWSLVHKSVTFFITGILIIVIVQRFDRKHKPSAAGGLESIKVVSISLVIAVQIAILGVQVGKSESLHANGDLIKLELAPVDPRSLLQGDYLILRYNISSLQLEEEGWNELVRIGLVKNKTGVYEYSGSYVVGKGIPSEIMDKADVWITGRLKGYENIEYGIENYFVPEGTGIDLQDKIHYAYVRVAANGDSMLVDIVEK